MVLANHAVSRGASMEAPPIPVTVPTPDSVFHTDNYGNSIAIDGDTLVVGAPWTTVNGLEQQGVAYIFTRNPNDPTGFTLLKSVTGGDSGKFHAFGWSVALDGDTLVIGTGNHGNITFTGAAYVFQRNQGGENQWGEVKKLVRADGRFTYFGRTLAIHADTIVVGAPLGLGQVFIHQRNQDGDNQWGKTQMLDGGIPITTTPKSASFGEAIAFDGVKLVISAPKI
ncbi:MAG: FG-GAP repeat protein, partial [Chloroflexota bacterium]|nr:FG-GAP repeat protein [Chloroflexota bacterium]